LNLSSESRRIREQKVMQDLQLKEKEEVYSTKFHANAVPQHIYVPRYNQMVAADATKIEAGGEQAGEREGE
jgi:hypothetical protein